MRRPDHVLPKLVAPLAWLRRRRDDANIRQLERHLGITNGEARRLYGLARIHGYGAAHRMVFGESTPSVIAGRSTTAEAPTPDGVTAGRGA